MGGKPGCKGLMYFSRAGTGTIRRSSTKAWLMMTMTKVWRKGWLHIVTSFGSYDVVWVSFNTIIRGLKYHFWGRLDMSVL